ncbi:MAG: bifunctional oligoribonuclease/PAP phosphatase NrnA [Desulfarculales bacterium]|jgi:phosphoesterase RecJ-like protein|nr:bifunctional oligoribonuclease/PAP phosphatase NrnA [Desulfarculales bacterium]
MINTEHHANIKQIGNELMSARHLLLAAHSDPDGDALGSMLGLYHLLSSLGCQIKMFREGQLPVDYSFLDGAEQVMNELPAAEWPDAVVLLDCHDPGRAGKILNDWIQPEHKIIVIDHHIGTVNSSYLICKEPTASATAELVTMLAEQMRWPINIMAANALFAGIVADTGYFSQSNTTGRVLRLAGWLVDNGATPAPIAAAAKSRALNRLRLHAEILNATRAMLGERLLLLQATRQQLSHYQCGNADLEGLVEQLMLVRGVMIGVLLKEITADTIKVSMRSKPHIDISELAMSFEGGGHKNAAGFKLAGSLDYVRDRLVQKIVLLLEHTNGR